MGSGEKAPLPIFNSNIMARRKTVETDSIETTVVQPESTEVENPTTETVVEDKEAEVPETPKEVTKSSKSEKVSVETEIPDYAKDILKVFKRFPELLITKDGGVFTADTKLPEHRGAILYKNPFYNS